MKKIIILIVLLCFFTGCTSNSEMDNADPTKQYYPLTYCKVNIEDAKNIGKDKPIDYADTALIYETYYGDSAGRLAEVVSGGSSKTDENKVWLYDDKGNLIFYDENRWVYDSIENQKRCNYEYDEKNNLIKEEQYNKKMGLESVILYLDYDENGNYTRREVIHSWDWDGLTYNGKTYSDYDEWAKYYYQHKYNDNGEKIATIESRKYLYGKWKQNEYYYEYDQYGNLIREKSPFVDQRWQYDSEGNILQKEDARLGTKETYTYDKNGNLLSYSYGTNDITIEKYKNKYDKHGNLVRRYTYIDDECKYYELWTYIPWEEWVDSFQLVW